MRAAVTATFHGAKVGLCVEPGKGHAGVVEVVEIGVPRGRPRAGARGPDRRAGARALSRAARAAARSSTPAWWWWPAARAGLTGAPTMVARSAQRAGAGYVQVAVPGPVQQVVELRLLEQMTPRPARRGRRAHARRGRRSGGAGRACRRGGAGPGPRAARRARWPSPGGWPREVEAPLLVDADGLNAHAGGSSASRGRDAPTVLTPHSAELGPPARPTPEEVERHRLAARPPGRGAERRRGAAEGGRHDRGRARAARWR